MGAKDIVTKDYTKESVVFADAFNQYIYKGEQVIKPENLRPLDTNLTGIPHGAEGAGVSVQWFRDVFSYEEIAELSVLSVTEVQALAIGIV